MHSGFVQFDAVGKILKLGKLTLVNLGEPGVQALSLTLAYHLEKVLGQVVGRFQIGMDLAQRGQIRLFPLIQMVRVSRKSERREAV